MTKLVFAIIFIIAGIIAITIGFAAKINQSDSMLYWLGLGSFSVIIGILVAKMPTNIRKLIKPSQLQAEINIGDYYWLAHMSEHFPLIKEDIQQILNLRNHISFNDLDNIWIKLGEYTSANKVSEQFLAKEFATRYTDLEKIKQHLLNME